MTRMMASLMHSADVILKGRRREARADFRLDVPFEIKDISRRELEEGIVVHSDYESRAWTLHSHDGGLWRPFVPSLRRFEFRRNDVPSEMAEDNAMTLAELQAQMSGAITGVVRDRFGRNGENLSQNWDDPLVRRRGTLVVLRHGPVPERERHVPASEHPRLEDADVKSVLWDDRAAAEQGLRAAASDLLAVDGLIWVRAQEPVLEVGLEDGVRVIHVTDRYTEPHSQMSMRQFRLDRMQDLLAWCDSRQGKSSFGAKLKSRDAPVDRTDFELMDASLLRRDDARVCLKSRLHDILANSAALAGSMPSDAVDRHIALRKLRDRDDGSRPTEDLYADLEALDAAAAAVFAQTDEEFDARDKFKSAASPVLARWREFESPQVRAGAPTP